MTSGFLRIAIVLGLVSAIGPFAIDMYLPALPTIGADLGASPLAVQMSLVVVFLSFAVGPLIVGPLADMHGRKPVMYGGLIVFALASIGAALAPNVEWLIFFRLLQGLGVEHRHGGAARRRARPAHRPRGNQADVAADARLQRVADPRAADRQRHHRCTSAGAPSSGRSPIAAVLAFVLMMFGLEETRPADQRGDSSFASAWAGYKVLVVDRSFVGLVADRRLRHSELLRLSRQLVLRGHRPLWPDAVAIQPVLLDQRGLVHRRCRRPPDG